MRVFAFPKSAPLLPFPTYFIWNIIRRQNLRKKNDDDKASFHYMIFTVYRKKRAEGIKKLDNANNILFHTKTRIAYLKFRIEIWTNFYSSKCDITNWGEFFFCERSAHCVLVLKWDIFYEILIESEM